MLLDKETGIKIFEQAVPIHRHIGLKVLELEKGMCKMVIPYREEFLGDFRARRWHGGMISLAMDSVGGAAAATMLTSVEDKLATIDLRVDYLRGTKPSDLVVSAKVVRSGNRIIACDMEAWQEGEQLHVANGRAMFSVYRAKD